MSQKFNKVLKTIIASVMVCGIVWGSFHSYELLKTSAYLTDTDSKTNVFTVGTIDIIGEEPHWPTENKDEDGIPDIPENTVPNQEIPKDPQIQNVDNENSAIVFMKVVVPREKVTLVNDDGSLSDCNEDGTKKLVLHDLFYLKVNGAPASDHRNTFYGSYSARELHAGNQGEANLKTVADGLRIRKAGSPSYELLNGTPIIDTTKAHWIQLGDQEVTTKAESTYVFGYSIPLAPNQTTLPLFDKVQIINHIEGQIQPDTEKTIQVHYYAIQSTGVLENSVDLTTQLNEENLTKIFDIYLNQNLENHYTGTTGQKDVNAAD